LPSIGRTEPRKTPESPLQICDGQIYDRGGGGLSRTEDMPRFLAGINAPIIESLRYSLIFQNVLEWNS